MALEINVTPLFTNQLQKNEDDKKTFKQETTTAAPVAAQVDSVELDSSTANVTKQIEQENQLASKSTLASAAAHATLLQWSETVTELQQLPEPTEEAGAQRYNTYTQNGEKSGTTEQTDSISYHV